MLIRERGTFFWGLWAENMLLFSSSACLCFTFNPWEAVQCVIICRSLGGAPGLCEAVRVPAGQSVRAALMNVSEREKKKKEKLRLKMAEGAASLKGLRAQMGRNSVIYRRFSQIEWRPALLTDFPRQTGLFWSSLCDRGWNQTLSFRLAGLAAGERVFLWW